jgi:ribosomal protein S27E
VVSNIEKIASLIKGDKTVELPTKQEILQYALEAKIQNNVLSINQMMKEELEKALSAGYGGAGVPTANTGGGVLQSEVLDDGRGSKNKSFKYVICPSCGHEQVYSKYQVKCRGDNCGKSFPMETLHKLFLSH